MMPLPAAILNQAIMDPVEPILRGGILPNHVDRDSHNAKSLFNMTTTTCVLVPSTSTSTVRALVWAIIRRGPPTTCSSVRTYHKNPEQMYLLRGGGGGDLARPEELGMTALRNRFIRSSVRKTGPICSTFKKIKQRTRVQHVPSKDAGVGSSPDEPRYHAGQLHMTSLLFLKVSSLTSARPVPPATAALLAFP